MSSGHPEPGPDEPRTNARAEDTPSTDDTPRADDTPGTAAYQSAFSGNEDGADDRADREEAGDLVPDEPEPPD